MEDFNKAPFNFVPLNHEVYIPEWGEQISQDIPFEDGEDGIIRFVITNTTPLYIKNGMQDNADDSLSAHIDDANGVRHYYIPATSIKGMLRSVLEILSFSKMQPYNKNSFGFRDFGGKQTSNGETYTSLMASANCGWLRQKDGSYELADCGEPEKIAISDLNNELFPSYKKIKDKNAVEKANYFNEHGFGLYPKIGDKYLVCSGKMQNKEHEQLVPPPTECKRLITVSEEDINVFKTVYKQSTDYYPFIVKQLNSSAWLPIFFRRDDEGKTKIGFTRMFRYPYKHDVSDAIRQTWPTDNEQAEMERDFSECLFGHINGKYALRGRVQFGNAFLEKDSNCDTIAKKGVLGQPKASFYPFYLKQTSLPYKTYDNDNIKISGRKRYRIHENNNLSPLPQGNRNENTMSTLHLLPAGKNFICEVKLHNVRAIEIGAILSAITFHKTTECHHSIGMGKAFGYGKLEISEISLDYLLHDELYYMREFEKRMTRFTLNTLRKRWIDTEQIRTLCSISADHKAALGYMTLEGYKEAKKTGNFSTLTESSVSVKTLLSDKDIENIFDCEIAKIISALEKEEYDKAIELCDNLLTRPIPTNTRLFVKNLRLKAKSKMEEIQKQAEDAEKVRIKQFEQMLTDIEACMSDKSWGKVIEKCDKLLAQNPQSPFMEKAKDFRERAENNIRIHNAGLSAFIDGKNIRGEYVVKDFNLALKKIEKWIKDYADDALLNADEESVVEQTLKRIYSITTKKGELKEWNSFESKYWRKLAQLLVSIEKAQKIYNSIFPKQ